MARLCSRLICFVRWITCAAKSLSFASVRIGVCPLPDSWFIVPLQQVVDNRDVIIVEDIVDTGLTIHQLKAHLRGLGATSVRVASMLFKPNKLEYEDAKPDYVGHEITDEFVIGYGLDFDGFVRNLDAIYKVKE